MGRGIRFTAEFKREAVRLALTSGRPRAEIAEDLGVGLSSLTRWVGQYRDEEMLPEIKDDLQAELKRLRKENAVLRQERDILKKAAWTLLTKVETSCDRILIAGGANVEAEWEQGPAV